MKAHTVFLLGLLILFSFADVHGRNHGRLDEQELQENEHVEKDNTRPTRHRRKRWNMAYGYHYPSPHYYNDRREQDLYPQILGLLEEIASYVRRPPPPPQPIYIPYPVLQACPVRTCNCVFKPSGNTKPSVPNTEKNSTNPKPEIRFPIIDDNNRNWGYEIPEEDFSNVDYSRPISFDPIAPVRPSATQPPPVDHGSTQAGEETSKKQARYPEKSQEEAGTASKLPSMNMCNAAILSCCNSALGKQAQKTCFVQLGCIKTYAGGAACEEESVLTALEMFTDQYSPR